jgi:hypothetical protein
MRAAWQQGAVNLLATACQILRLSPQHVVNTFHATLADIARTRGFEAILTTLRWRFDPGAAPDLPVQACTLIAAWARATHKEELASAISGVINGVLRRCLPERPPFVQEDGSPWYHAGCILPAVSALNTLLQQVVTSKFEVVLQEDFVLVVLDAMERAMEPSISDWNLLAREACSFICILLSLGKRCPDRARLMSKGLAFVAGLIVAMKIAKNTVDEPLRVAVNAAVTAILRALAAESNATAAIATISRVLPGSADLGTLTWRLPP